MSKRNVSILSVVALCVLVTVIGCSVNAGGTPGGGGFVSFTILGKTFTFTFGNAGVVNTQANQTVTQAAALRLFEEPPQETPPNGQMQLLSSDVGVAQLLSKGSRTHQASPPEGSATIRFLIAAGTSADLCDSATLLAEFQLNVVAGAASIANEVYELSQAALEVITANDVTLCIEVTANFDGELTLTEFSLTFGGGEGGVLASFSLENQDTENIHILMPGEDFDPAVNRITPGSTRTANLDGLEVGDTVTLRAGRNGTVLDTDNCPAVAEAEYSATAVWDGAQLTCSASQGGGVPPGTGLQVPIDAAGQAVSPNATYNGINYSLVGVLQSVSPEAPPANLASSVNVDLGALGLQYVERVHLAQIAVYVPDVPGGEEIGTATFEYAEGGSPTTLEFTLGGNTADWAIERPENVGLGWTSQGLGPILYTFDTMVESASIYDGHGYRADVDLDTSRTLARISLAVVDPSTLTRPANSPTPTWAAMAFIGVTLAGPAGSPNGGGPPTGATGSVSGQVVNALTGAVVSGAGVTVSGTSLSTATDGSGAFTLTGVPVGAQDLVVTAVGFAQNSTAIVVLAGATANAQVGLVPLGEAGDLVTIVLAWGEVPTDLDLHMSGPNGSGGRFHASFSVENPVVHAFLDLDDTDSFGPETMTIRPAEGGEFVAGEYHIWIHNFHGAPGFDVSEARIIVTAGGAQLGQFNVSQAAGNSADNIWQVINITVGADGAVTAVSPVQTFTTGDSSSVF